MIIGWLLGLLTLSLDGMNAMVNAHGADFAFSTNPNIVGFMSYMMQANHFFPLDTYFVIAGLYFFIYSTAAGVKVVEVVLNLVRGAGMKL